METKPAGMPGNPAPGKAWRITTTPTFCEEPVNNAFNRQTGWPDSAAAVAVAKRALGNRVTEHSQVSSILRTEDGTFIKFVDDRPNVVDGSASVYVNAGPCVTFLGW